MCRNLVMVLLSLCFVSGVYAQLPVTDGLIVYLRADSLTGLQDGDPVTAWVDSAQDDPVDGTVGDVGSGAPEYKVDVLYGKPVVRFNGAEALASMPFVFPDAQAGVTVAAVATGDKTDALHERLGHVGARLATGGNLISMDVSARQNHKEGSGFRVNNGYALVGTPNPNPMDTNFHVGIWQAAQGTTQSSLVYYLDGIQQPVAAKNPNNTIIFPDTDNVIAVGDGYNPQGAFYPGDFVTADLAVFIVYNRVLSQAEVETLSEYLRSEYLVHMVAVNPEPASGAVVNDTSVALTWESGEGATSHQVYLSTNQEEVTNAEAAALIATTTEPNLTVGTIAQPLADGLVPGATYYWRVDEAAAGSITTGSVWSFSIRPATAYEPVPADNGVNARTDQVLSWQPGLGALLHTVYFGTDAAAVDAAEGGTPQAETETSYTPAALEPDTTYYWRVDEFSVTGTVKGPVWSFTTIDEIPIQDESLLGWWTMDQVDSLSILDMSGHGRHGVVYGDIEWVEGIAGTAIELDMNDRIVIPPVDVNVSTTTMTAWVRPDEIAKSIKGIIYRRGGGGVGGLKVGPGNQVGYTWNDNPDAYNWESNLFVPAGEWSFIALVLDPTQATIYLNGPDIQRTNTLEHLEMAFDQDMTLGHDPLDAGRRFVGAMDDLRFYSRALTGEELAAVIAVGTKPVREVDPMVIEDFDAYNAYQAESGQNVWDVWVDGYGGNGTGSTAGNVEEPFMNRSNAVEGGQALPLLYDNTGMFVDIDGQSVSVYVSEVMRTFSPPQDFTRGGSAAVTLWIRGDAGNIAQPSDTVYLGVKDTAGNQKFVTIAPAVDLTRTYWLQKKVDFSTLAGVDLARIAQMTLGIGTKAAPQMGGSGVVLIDNIVLAAE